MQYENTVLFVSSADDNLYSYNMETEEVSPFCKDATCDHKGVNCAAGGVNCNLEQYDGKVYGKNLLASSMKELKNGVFEQAVSGIYHFWHSGGNLYVATQDKSLLVYENGGKPKTLLDEYTGYWETIFDGYLYFESNSCVYRVNLQAEHPQTEILVENADFMTDGTHIYYVPYDTFYLYRCNMDGSGKTLLLEKPVLPGTSNFDEEYYYFRLYTNQELRTGEDSQDLYRFPKSDPTKIEKIAHLDNAISTVYTVPGYDKIFVVCVTVYEDYSRDEFVYTMNKDGGNVKQLEIPIA